MKLNYKLLFLVPVVMIIGIANSGKEQPRPSVKEIPPQVNVAEAPREKQKARYALHLLSDGTVDTHVQERIGSSSVWACQAETDDLEVVNVFSSNAFECTAVSLEDNEAVREAVFKIRSTFYYSTYQ